MMTTFDTLADPTRIRILELLLEQLRLVGNLVDPLEMSQHGLSKHILVLRATRDRSAFAWMRAWIAHLLKPEAHIRF